MRTFRFFKFWLAVFLFFPSFFVLAAGGQLWSAKPPSNFDKSTGVAVNCTNYQKNIQAVIEDDINAFDISIGGEAPPCGTPFNLYDAISENFGEIASGTEIALCLADTATNGTQCLRSGDDSLVKTVFGSLVAARPIKYTARSAPPPAALLPLASAEPGNEKINKFERWFSRGFSGEDVKNLQEFLAKNPALYPEGLVTGYFGPLTEEAVKRFQTKYNIVSSGDPISTGFGFVGPKTLKKLNELILK